MDQLEKERILSAIENEANREVFYRSNIQASAQLQSQAGVSELNHEVMINLVHRFDR